MEIHDLKSIQGIVPRSGKCCCIVLQIVDIIIEKAAANITDEGDRDLVLESIYNPVAGETNLHSFCVDPSVHDVIVSLIGPSAVLSLYNSTGKFKCSLLSKALSKRVNTLFKFFFQSYNTGKQN